MTRTVTAMFDSRSQAEAARERLTQSRIDADDVRIVDQSETGSEAGEGQGLWAAIKSVFIPPEDSHSYEEGLRRGSYLLCARVDEDRADEAIRILDESDSVDLDERETGWRSEGWSPYSPTGGGSGSGPQATERTEPEEALRFGRRETERGGVRARSYVAQHVNIEPRAVDGPVSETDMQSGIVQDRDVEMTDLDEGVRETAGRSAFGSFGGDAPGDTEEESSRSDSFEDSDKRR
ncbi:MAG TPA: hypothetical protein VE053_11855 [Allosphingosinicella sp.]|nr:hypothetical protein [Allosphingosinicella sp.]